MKIHCQCGATIFDQTDCLPHKAHLIPDRDWFNLLDAIDEAIEATKLNSMESEAASMKVRKMISGLSMSSWQCSSCGSMYINDHANRMHLFSPSREDGSRELFHVKRNGA